MQPLFLKELIPHRDLQELKQEEDPYKEETKEEEDTLSGSNIFDDKDERPVSPASSMKKFKGSIRR